MLPTRYRAAVGGAAVRRPVDSGYSRTHVERSGGHPGRPPFHHSQTSSTVLSGVKTTARRQIRQIREGQALLNAKYMRTALPFLAPHEMAGKIERNGELYRKLRIRRMTWIRNKLACGVP
jgi:hypothetical protein